MKTNFKNSPNILLLISCIYMACFVWYGSWRSFVVHAGDQSGYYQYLPAIFIHHDLKSLDKTTAARYKNLGKEDVFSYKKNKLANNNHLNTYTSGVAIIQIIPFFIGHGLASLGLAQADGFTWPYALTIGLWSIILLFFAWQFLYKILIRWISQKAAIWSILFIGMTTHLLPNTILKGNMSHIYLFCLIVYMFYALLRFMDSSKKHYLFLSAFLAGLIVMARPSEITIICLLIWFLTQKTFRSRLTIPSLSWSIVIGLIAPAIQFGYWKYISGHFFVDSYRENTFDFTNPFILKGLFSFQNGFFPYAVICLIALLGLIPLLRKHKSLGFCILIYLVLHVYITYSWDNWYYINGYGSRPMLSTLFVWAILLGFTIDWFIQYGKIWLTLLAVLSIHNLFSTWQIVNGILFTEESNPVYYWHTLGRTKVDENLLKIQDIGQRQYAPYVKTRVLKRVHTIQDSMYTAYEFKDDFAKVTTEFSPITSVSLDPVDFTSPIKLRLSATVYFDYKPYDMYTNNLFFVHAQQGSNSLIWKSSRMNNKIAEKNEFGYFKFASHTIKNIYFDVHFTPESAHEPIDINIGLWNNYNSNPTFIKKLTIEQIVE